MEELLISSIANYGFWVYFLIIVIAIIEGPILSIVIGMLIQGGYFNWMPVYAILMFGDLLGDCIWYFIGKIYGHGFIKRYGKYFKITENKFEKVIKLFQKYKVSILMISKLTNGFGFGVLTLITAGMSRISLGKYVFINSVAQFLWTGLLVGTGYFFAESFMFIEKMMGRLNAIGFGIVAIIILYIAYRSIKEKIVKRFYE